MATVTDETAAQPEPAPLAEGEAMDHQPSKSPDGSPEVIHEPPDPLNPPKDIKAILKKDPHVLPTGQKAEGAAPEDRDANSGSADHKPKKKKKKKSLKWDENAIEEHDQLRGTRMKIDEPNTPYAHYDHHGDHSDEDSAKHPHTPPAEEQKQGPCLAQHWDSLETKLVSVAAARDAYPSSPSASSRDGGSVHSDEEEARKRREHEREFKMHRKHHYNEMEMLRRFRAEHPKNPLDNDEDENDDDDMEL